ncbi:MAG: DMT family transporter [Chloroflexi bacterium]|nr:MAG: DMT family transporter [Chloroflexota bacterium]
MLKLSKTNKTAQSFFYLGLCILSWGLIPVVTKNILVELNNLQMLFYSTIFSCIVMGGIVLFQKKISVLATYSIHDYAKVGMLGFLGTYLYYVLLYAALALTSASEGFILAYTWPMLVIILAFPLLKERLTVKKLCSIFISFLGIVVIVTHGSIFTLSFTSLQGDMLALGGAGVFALFSVLGKKYHYDQVVSVFIYFVTALVIITPTLFLFSSLKVPSFHVWLWLLLNGFLVNGISYIFWFKALEYGDTSVTSNALYLTPFLSLVYIALFLGEQILLSSIVGLVIIVVGIVLQSVNLRQEVPVRKEMDVKN